MDARCLPSQFSVTLSCMVADGLLHLVKVLFSGILLCKVTSSPHLSVRARILAQGGGLEPQLVWNVCVCVWVCTSMCA